MGTWTQPQVYFAGNKLTFTELNAISQDLQWVKDALKRLGVTDDTGSQSVKNAVIGARLHRDSSFAVESGVTTNVPFDTLVMAKFDGNPAGFHDSSRPTLLTVPVDLDGYWLVGGTVGWAGNSTNQRGVAITLNGTIHAWRRVDAVSSGRQSITLTTAVYGDEADFLTLAAYQNSGSDLDVTYARFWMTRVGR